MTITVTQTCDGCGTSRELRVGPASSEGPQINDHARKDGWIPVLAGQHLCVNCIKGAINKKNKP